MTALASTTRPPLAAASGSGRRREEAFLPCAPLWGLGILPVSSGSRTPPSNLTARGGFQCKAGPKLFETLKVLRPPGALFSCFFFANVATATAPAAPPSPDSIRRIWSKGLMMGGVVGAIFLFDLIWLLHRHFWAK